MCPQLLSKVKPGAHIEFGSDSILERPKLSPYVAQVITSWSYCEAAYTSMLTHFLHADFRVVHEMFYAIRSPDARRQILQAAAEERLINDELHLFNAVKKCTNASRLKRNDFAHRLWGISSHLPDALLLGSPKISTEYDVYMAQALSGKIKDKDKEIDRYSKNFESIYVYRENDLQHEANEAKWCYVQINGLLTSLSRPDDDGREQARTELLAEPRIRDCAANLSQKTSLESPQRSQIRFHPK